MQTQTWRVVSVLCCCARGLAQPLPRTESSRVASMDLVRRCYGIGLTLAIVFLPALRVDPSNFDPVNLDLPYNASGGDDSEEEDEDWVEVVRFYEVSFETNAVVFCLDGSQSMFERNGRWETQKQEITKAILDLNSRAMFGVVVWSKGVTTFRRTLQPATIENKRMALHFVNSRRSRAGQALSEGLIESLKMIRKSDMKHLAVVLTSDGQPNNLRGGKLFSASLAANPGRKAQVHTISIGGASADFMKKLASIHGGQHRNAP